MTVKPKYTRSKEIQKWIDRLIEQADFAVKPTTLARSTNWLVVDGAIRHSSGLFFNIVGVVWDENPVRPYSQPFIEQREIGSLGFLLSKESHMRQLLVQAKIEPGNVGVVQLAPTYQATASNAARIHGGKHPLYPTNFYPKSRRLIFETLQSEQGGRFLGKQNRNILSVADSRFNAASTHRWFAVDEFLELLIHDNLVNTDARSVLVCSPWEELVSRKPFSRHSTSFSKNLQESYSSKSGIKLKKIESEINSQRSQVHPIRIVDINNMDGWQLTDIGIKPRNGQPFAVRQIQVTAKTREVPSWDQPIIDSKCAGYVDLVCGRKSGTLNFLFRMRREPGLHDYVELSPTFIQEPGIADVPRNDSILKTRGDIIAESRQSDEGGRFYKDINRYRIIDVGEAYDVDKGWCWLTLGEIKALIRKGSYFTNESRSVLSLLLQWL